LLHQPEDIAIDVSSGASRQQGDAYVGFHFLSRVGIKEKLCLFIGFDLDIRRRLEEMSRGKARRTSNFLLAQPSSSAGSSTPFKRVRHRNAESGSSNSAKPKPWGLFAGVMRRLKDLTGPHPFGSNGKNELN